MYVPMYFAYRDIEKRVYQAIINCDYCFNGYFSITKLKLNFMTPMIIIIVFF